ncbi:MAG: DUF6049 family protein [Actinomycetota bacterium]|nr:DUF6049 family protein [Actinomycetota bacterium]
MRTLYRALGALSASVLVATTLLVAPPAALGQETVVRTTLSGQTPFTTKDESVVTVTFLAENLGEGSLDDLSVGFSIGPAIRSRVGYTSSLIEGPGSTLVFLDTFSQTGTIEAGAVRELSVSVDLSEIDEVSEIDSSVYPARIELRVAGLPVAWIDTPLIHIVRTPDDPIDLAWWVELDAPIAMNPQGQLADAAFETAIAPRGGLRQQVEALRDAVAPDDGLVAIDLVVVPAVIDQLARMADGYERAQGDPVPEGERPATDAAGLLATLRELVADDDVHVIATPFAAPLLPSLASGGLTADLDGQQDLGEAVISEQLGHTPVTATARPPQGALDDASVAWLAARGATTILAEADSVARPAQPNDFTLLPVAAVSTGDGTTVDLVLPNPGLQERLGDPILTGDPVRASQTVLGELAAIWREAPVSGPQLDGSETVRGVALSLPASLPPALWAPLVRRVSRAPFVQLTHAGVFAGRVHPVQDDAAIVESLARFPRDYVDAIREQHRNVAAYRSMLVDPSPEPDRLDRSLLFAEAGDYVDDPLAGRAWYDQVSRTTGAIFQGLLPDVQQEFLLTSSEGSIPVRMGDPGPTPLTVQVVLRSAAFEFPGGSQRMITLEGPNQVEPFDVVAKASGPQPIKVKIRAPSGRDLGEDQNLTVRTTAVSSVALWTTIGAGVVLVLLWSRRLVRRPKL